jgi:hypothetical protein
MDEWEGVLFRPEGAAAESVPPVEDFEDYRLPGHERTLILEANNAVPRDGMIRFIEKPHLYLVRRPDGTEHQIFSSVTTVAGAAAEPFDEVAIIAKMKKPTSKWSQAWPRLQYACDVRKVPPQCVVDGSVIGPKRGILLYSQGPTGDPFTHAALLPRQVQTAGFVGASLKVVVRALPVGSHKPEGPLCYATFSRGMTDAEILSKWAANSKDASDRGTDAHFQAEQFMNGLIMHPSRELDVCMDFCRTHMVPTGARPFRTEWEIFSALAEDGGEAISGSVDLVVQYPNGELGIVDWKRSPKLHCHMWGFGNRPRQLAAPLDHLDDCDGVKYTFQLNIYAYLMERYYGHRVRSLTLCSIHPDQPYSTDVPRLWYETAYVMAVERRRAAVYESIRQTHEGGPEICQLTGEVRTHAMRPADGSDEPLVQHGAIYTHGLNPDDFVPDPEGQRAVARAALLTAVPSHDAEVEAAAANLAAHRQPWRSMMPEVGLTECMRPAMPPRPAEPVEPAEPATKRARTLHRC